MTTDSFTDPVAPRRLTGADLIHYQTEGYLPIDRLLAPESAEAMRGETLALTGADHPSKLRQTSDYSRGSTIDHVVNSPNLHALAEQLLGGPCTLFLPFTAVKTPGGGQFHFHQDNNYTAFNGPGLNLWFALVDTGPENGCLMIAPRSHLHGTLDSENAGDGDNHRKVTLTPEHFLPISMRAGDCVAFGRLTVHGSGPNMTSVPRVGYAVQYFRDDVTFVDKETGETKLLLSDSPHRHRTKPLTTG